MPSGSRVSHRTSDNTPTFTSHIDSTIHGWHPDDSLNFSLDADDALYNRELEADISTETSPAAGETPATQAHAVDEESVAAAKNRTKLSVRSFFLFIL